MCFLCSVTVDGHKLEMKTELLSTLEILNRLDEFSRIRDPKKDEQPLLLTKAGKKKAGKKR